MFKFVNAEFLRKFWPSVLLKTNSGAGLGVFYKSWERGCLFSVLLIKIYLMLSFQQNALFIDSTSGADKISIFFLYFNLYLSGLPSGHWEKPFSILVYL